MSIRLIAKDLYDLIRRMEDLKRRIEEAPPAERDVLRDELRRLTAERNHVQRMLDGCKDDSPRKPV